MAKFQPGNPGGPGRPKMTEEQKTAKQMARALVGKAMTRLEEWVASDNPKASVSASVAIIERAEGRPLQEIVGDFSVTHHDARDRLVRKLKLHAEAQPAATNGSGIVTH